MPSQPSRCTVSQTKWQTNTLSKSMHQWTPVAPHLGSSRSGIPQNKQLVLSWSRDTPGIFGTHGPSVSHICINARMTPSNPLLQSSGPLPGMVIWSGTGHLDIRTSGHLLPAGTGHQNVRWSTKTAPTHWLLCQNKPKFGDLNGLNSF